MPAPKYGPYRSSQDLLPPFPALTTDEDREKKAQMWEPGTYLVVAISELIFAPLMGNGISEDKKGGEVVESLK